MAHEAAAQHDDHGHPDDGQVHSHVSKFGFLVAIFLALIFLTVVTVAVSYVDLGAFNGFVAIFVATLKATLVGLFFMHLRYDKPFNAFVFLMGFAFLATFMILTMSDLSTRARVDTSSGTRVLPRTAEWAPGGPDHSRDQPAASGSHGGGAAGGGGGGGGSHH